MNHGKVNASCFFQRLNQSTNVQLETQRLTRTATLQGTETVADRKQGPEKKKTASKVSKTHVLYFAQLALCVCGQN